MGDLLTLQNPKGAVSNGILKSIKLPSKLYSKFKVYDNEDIKYNPFFYKNDEQIPLWELQTEEEISTGDSSFKGLEELENLKDMVVLLYLENYSKSGDLCTGLSCDNQGIEQVGKAKGSFAIF